MTVHGRIHNPELRRVLYSQNLRQIAFSPLAADDNWFKTATTPTAGENKTSTVTSFTADYCPGWPVVPVVVATDAAADDWTAVSVTIKGYDQFGDFISETAAGANSSGTWTATLVNAFRKLESASITITGTTTGSDSFVIGYAKTYGLGCKITATSDVIAKLFNGSADAGTVSAVNNTYVVAGTPDAAKELVLTVDPTGYYK